MRPLCVPTLGLALLLIGCSSSDPDVDLRPQAVRSSVCEEHTNLHNRMDVVEKTVEDTVEKLEGELVALLDQIEDPQWSRLVDSAGQSGGVVDIFEDPELRKQS